MVVVSFTVSAVILGIALSNLPFGFLADRLPIRPLILTGGVMVMLGDLICALTHDFWILIAARFLQGFFIPALTTCLAAYIARTVSVDRLNVLMGAYVSATVLGGLSGRLLGGFIHPPLHWRYAFLSAGLLMLLATVAALRVLPASSGKPQAQPRFSNFWTFLQQGRFLRIFFCAAGSFAVFSSIFNYLPFRLSEPAFSFSTEKTTLLYLVYIIGIFMGPTAGRLSNRFGSGPTLIGGAAILGGSLLVLLLPSVPAIILGLIGTCGGFFTVHAAAVGTLNRKLSGGQGQANALYVLFYYVGGWVGITLTGLAYKHSGWPAVVFTGLIFLLVPLYAGWAERKSERA